MSDGDATGVARRTSAWLRSAYAVYGDPHMLTLGALGFASGLPRLLVFSTLTFWLMEVGISIESVGLFAATSLPYTLKFLWAPIIDRAPFPVLGRWLGQRRGWMLATQLGLIASLVGLGCTDPSHQILATAIMALCVAIFSASQDVVIDAYRVDSLAEDEQGAGAAVAVLGYRVGMLVAGAGALSLAALLEDNWGLVYAGMAGCMSVGVAATLIARSTDSGRDAEVPDAAPDEDRAPWHLRAWDAVWGPLRDVVGRRGAWAFLLFIMLFKLGDALAGTMLNPLLIDLGFTKLQIAGVAKTEGLIATLVGVFLGGWLVKHIGVWRALWIAGFMQMFSNLVFVGQALIGANVWVLAVTIGVENICGGIGTAAFVAYLSGLCRKRYTATQYALLTAFASLIKTALSTTTGFLAAALGWPLYFGMTAVSAIPGIIMIWWLGQCGLTGLREETEPPSTA